MQNNVLQNSCKQSIERKKNDGKKKIKVKEKKSFNLQVNCICKRKCAERIDILKQQEIFENFNKLSDWPNQTRFLRGLISSKPTNENLDPIISAKKKENSYTYHFVDESGSLTQVCLSFFTKVLQIERTKVFRAVNTMKRNPDAIEKRGKSTARRTNPSDLKHLKNFISSFVAYESSRNPKKANEKFVHPRLNLRKIYLLYSKHCAFQNRKLISDTIFRRVFHGFDMRIKQRSQSKCPNCEESKKDLEKQHNLNPNGHIEIVRSIKNELIGLVEKAQMPAEKTEIFTFKLQNAIDLPHISDDDIYFKQQLWCNILTVYDEVRDITHFYSWNETDALRGPNEIISCLYKHFNNHLPKDTQKIILFSDPNGTRNLKTSLMLQKFFDYSKSDKLEVIEQHFFSPNHCYCSCDRSFQTVQSNMKLDEIFVQENLIDSIKKAKKNDPKFKVTSMPNKSFFSTQNLENLLLSTKTTNDDERIQWSDYQKIIYRREQPFSMDVVKYGDTTIKTITLQAKYTPDLFSTTNLSYSNMTARKISKSKYNDLQTISKHIPAMYHEYYRSLVFDQNDSSKIDYALVNCYSSDEE